MAVASHQCSMDLRGEVATIQHMEMMAQPGPHYAAGASPLCENIVCRIRYKRSCPAASGGAACRHDPDLNDPRVLVCKPFCVVRYPSCCGAAGNDPLLPVSGVKPVNSFIFIYLTFNRSFSCVLYSFPRWLARPSLSLLIPFRQTRLAGPRRGSVDL